MPLTTALFKGQMYMYQFVNFPSKGLKGKCSLFSVLLFLGLQAILKCSMAFSWLFIIKWKASQSFLGAADTGQSL